MLKYDSAGQPFNDTVLGVKLAYSIDDDNNVDSLSKKVLEKATKATIDRRIFIPYNQAWMLATTAAGEVEVGKSVNGKVLDSYLFHAWGDYNNSDGSPRSVVGFIFEVKFATVLAAYKLKGKTEDSLKSWIRDKFRGKRPNTFLDDWFSGTVFKSDGSKK